MQKIVLMFTMLGLAMVSLPTLAAADDQQRDRVQEQSRDKEVYGWALMTPQEREEHRKMMREAKTEKERERIRHEHHEKMEKRAKEQGVKIPDEPRERGMGRGMGGGMGGSGPRGGGPNR